MFSPAGKWYSSFSRTLVLLVLFGRFSKDNVTTEMTAGAKKKKNEFTNESWSGKFRVRKVAFMLFSLLSCSLFMLSLLNLPKVWWKLPSFDDRLTVISTFNYFSRFCPVDYIRHTHHAFIIIFEWRHGGCYYTVYYGFAPCLSRSPLHGSSFRWLVFIFFFPPHPTQLYLGCVSFIQKRLPVFPNLISCI